MIRDAVPDDLPRLSSHNAVPQGRVLWYGSGKSLIRLDLDTWKSETVAEGLPPAAEA